MKDIPPIDLNYKKSTVNPSSEKLYVKTSFYTKVKQYAVLTFHALYTYRDITKYIK